jgi:thiamine-phosphate pyrophosphorylase
VTFLPPRLYAILDLDAAGSRGLTPAAVAAAWLQAGVRLMQLRAKPLSFGPMLELATDLVRQGRAAGAAVVVNDRADVAKLAGAAGVHVGQDDLSAADVRAMLGPAAIVGVSAHSPDEVAAACRPEVSYVAIGPVFATGSKRSPEPAVGLSGVREAARIARRAGHPLVAIGGITIDRAPEVLAAGAASVAVIAGLLAGETAATARAWLEAVGLENTGDTV